jgi:hypothetical protein
VSLLSWKGRGEKITEAGREAWATMEEGIGQGVVTMEGAAQRVMTVEVDVSRTEGDPDRVPGIGSGVERGRVRGRVRGRRWGRRKAARETATMDAAENHIIVRVFKHMLLRL